MENLPNVSFVTIMHNWENFCILFENTWNTIDYPNEIDERFLGPSGHGKII